MSLGLLAFWAALLIPAFGSHNGVSPPIDASLPFWQQRLLGVWSHWDGEWFLHVAEVGYRPGEVTAPFFPLYPVLVRLVNVFLGENSYLLAGVVAGGIAGLATFCLFYRLVEHDFDKPLAKQSVIYLAVFPTSFFLTACYSEGLFLALALGAFLVARRYSNRWLAGVLVGLASLTRNLGLLLLIPLGWEWLQQQRPTLFNPAGGRLLERLKQNWRAVVGLVLLGGWSITLFSSWLLFQAQVLGDPFKFVTLQSQWMWDRESAWPWETLGRSIWLVLSGKGETLSSSPPGFHENHNLLDLGFWAFIALLFLVACYQSWRKRLPFSYLLWFGLALVVPMFSPSPQQPLMSFPRFSLLAFPAFVVLAQMGLRWRFVHYAYLISGLLLLALLFSRFANWYWVA